MAMDKNDKVRLFKRVPKIEKNEELSLDDQIYFVETQIEERQKVLWREMVTVKTAEYWADQDDKDANTAAERAVAESVPRMKSLKLELQALQNILKGLKEKATP